MEKCQFKDIDDVIPLQPEVPFFNDLHWKLDVIQSRVDGVMKEQIKRKKKYFIFRGIDPKGQGRPKKSSDILYDFKVSGTSLISLKKILTQSNVKLEI